MTLARRSIRATDITHTSKNHRSGATVDDINDRLNSTLIPTLPLDIPVTMNTVVEEKRPCGTTRHQPALLSGRVGPAPES
jgi:hypothetical protein